MPGRRVNVNDDRVRQKEFLIIPNASWEERRVDAERKTHFPRGTEVDAVTFTKRSLFRKGNLPCISSPATETFAKRDLFSGLCEAETVWRVYVCAGNAHRKRIQPALGEACVNT